MSNQLTMEILEEGWRNARVKIAGILDTSDVTLAPAVSLNDFSNNDKQLTLVGLRVDFVEFAISNGIDVVLTWNSLTPQLIYALSARGKMAPYDFGGLHPNQSLTGYDGSINLSTTGFNSITAQQGGTQTFAVEINFVKLYK